MVTAGKTEERRKEPIVVCISGMAGSGKSTLARKIAQEYGLTYFSGGDALKLLAIERGYKSAESGWWESEEGMRFLKNRGKNHRFDEEVDKKQLEMAEKGNVVLDSWTMPWLVKKGFKIWLEASKDRRAERIARRDGISVKEALKALTGKEEQTKSIYKRLYGFSLGDDFSPFDLILDTDSLEADEVFQVLCAVMENVVLKPEDR
jgi:cytidylate kinase